MHTDFLTFDAYQHLGLKCGLEVHQQLRTRHKLFCKCPNTTYTDRYDAEILRHMRPTLSEMGEYDRTALMEFRTRKEILYRLNRERVCTYEIDDAPPFDLNREALEIAIEIAGLFHCNIVGEIHIARKQYLDGSIPTGFQRTMIVGLEGWFPMNGRRIRVRQLSLEEDACREISDVGHRRTYFTDRLCIPLIEVVTEPDFRTPEEARQGAEVIRRTTRVTGKVRRGAGSTRQDTNVSVSGGDRVEIKGVPGTRYIPHLVHWEGIRQRALLEISATLKHRGLTRDDFADAWIDVTDLVRLTTWPPLRDALAKGHVARAIKLPRFTGILNHSLGQQRRFVDEVRDRVRVVACLDGAPNLLYSEDPQPNVAQRIWQRAASALGAGEHDSLVLVWGPARDVQTAAEEVLWRCRDALLGVLPDTRQVEEDGTTRFERVLAGPNRMYPDTDMPPVAITVEQLARIAAASPAPPWERYDVLTKEYGLPHDAADALILDGNADLYLRAVREVGAPPRFASHLLTNAYRRLQRRWEAPERIPEQGVLDFFRAYVDGRFTREVAYRVLELLAHDPAAGIDGALAGVPVLEKLSKLDLDACVHPALEAQRALLTSKPRAKAEHVAMGLVREATEGRARGPEIRQSVARWFDLEEVLG
jgi:glutamyl-tRNA(Gln) amidotransferase subunit E